MKLILIDIKVYPEGTKKSDGSLRKTSTAIGLCKQPIVDSKGRILGMSKVYGWMDMNYESVDSETKQKELLGAELEGEIVMSDDNYPYVVQ